MSIESPRMCLRARYEPSWCGAVVACSASSLRIGLTIFSVCFPKELTLTCFFVKVVHCYASSVSGIVLSKAHLLDHMIAQQFS